MITQKGAPPRTRHLAVATTGLTAAGDGYYRFPALSTHVQIQNLGANVLRVYFTADDYTADTNYVQIPAVATATPGFWEGPALLAGIWVRSVTGATTAGVTVFIQQG